MNDRIVCTLVILMSVGSISRTQNLQKHNGYIDPSEINWSISDDEPEHQEVEDVSVKTLSTVAQPKPVYAPALPDQIAVMKPVLKAAPAVNVKVMPSPALKITPLPETEVFMEDPDYKPYYTYRLPQLSPQAAERPVVPDFKHRQPP